MEHSGLVQTEVVETIEFADDRFVPWPVWWSAIWVGALTALAVALVIGLAGVAVGAHQLGARRIVDWREVGLPTLVFSVLGTFLAFAAGGWAAGKVGGIRRAETAMLHGAIVWVLSVPLLLGLVALGAGAFLGEWYGGLAGTPAWAAPTAPSADATTAAAAARNGALGALTALLVGLMGSVIGGWMASGTPMTLRGHRAYET